VANRLATLLSHANERGKYGYDNLTKKMERFGNRVTTRAVLKLVVGFFITTMDSCGSKETTRAAQRMGIGLAITTMDSCGSKETTSRGKKLGS